MTKKRRIHQRDAAREGVLKAGLRLDDTEPLEFSGEVVVTESLEETVIAFCPMRNECTLVGRGKATKEGRADADSIADAIVFSAPIPSSGKYLAEGTVHIEHVAHQRATARFNILRFVPAKTETSAEASEEVTDGSPAEAEEPVHA